MLRDAYKVEHYTKPNEVYFSLETALATGRPVQKIRVIQDPDTGKWHDLRWPLNIKD